MTNTNRETQPNDITIEPANRDREVQKSRTDVNNLLDENTKKRVNARLSFGTFFYDSRHKTVLGRDALNWVKLSIFYAIFYCFLGCFFVGLTYIFAFLLDRTQPRYFNTESTMAVRSTNAIVGMGFRPQPSTSESLVRITNNSTQQQQIASSLELFRNVFLLQNHDAKVEECSIDKPASKLQSGAACSFNWHHIVNNDSHPCSDKNLYGFKYEQPCILVKLNKVYEWKPIKGVLPLHIQELRGVLSDKSTSNSDVYVTCAGTHPADDDILTNVTYYSLNYPVGSSKFGVIPNYFFPFRNAKDHVQPFVLVQFNKLPLNRLVSITCRAWAPGIEHNARRMRGMVNFQLYRAYTDMKSNDNDVH
ncbi:unnamed protein product [Rotaria magnacalcarata]|uniref:Sodium/potassium-transporting ATPase subunit beta-1 n=1 Tax=Rotaria magnacalcarata TaxID=392030 RepID=A0A816XHJ7_9BILA|nr:unnamed protein product [Rotaria magnacalcarata]CAF2147130.1 unnamed protein product [Rotaria magnacalcarata]CAF3845674.1 unnamed protein product [Rotaria magnacalcarata]CAF3890692.1 unnamed protein product [Rotaria magnacalcarata]